MAGLRVHFVFPAGLVERVDAALTVGQSRGEFVRVAVERALDAPSVDRLIGRLEGEGVLAPAEQPPPCARCDGYPEGVRCPECGQVGDAPPHSGPKDVYRGPEVEAEWRARSSVRAKRDVRPVPKAKP